MDNRELIQDIAENCVKGFAYNLKTLSRANGIVVLSCVTGENGSLKGKVEGEQPADHAARECFDAGLVCQQFCLAAYAKGGVPASWGD